MFFNPKNRVVTGAITAHTHQLRSCKMLAKIHSK